MGVEVVLITNRNLGRLCANRNENCTICKTRLNVGERAIRKRATHGHQKWYHRKCFQRLYH